MKEILEEAGMRRSLVRITHEILEKNKGIENLVIVGIETRGATLAKRLAANIEKFEGSKIPFFSLDISSWRDDHKKEAKIPAYPYDFKDKKVVLVDDVIYTGRSTRAAIEAIMKRGRPKNIQLAVLIDRGHREIPIRADYVGKNVPTSTEETVLISKDENDIVDRVAIFTKQ